MFYPTKGAKIQISHFNPVVYIINIIQSCRLLLLSVNFRLDYNTLFSNIGWSWMVFHVKKEMKRMEKRSVYARGWGGGYWWVAAGVLLCGHRRG
jgi:hypothetical protein